MPHDRNGHILKAGDAVRVIGIVCGSLVINDIPYVRVHLINAGGDEVDVGQEGVEFYANGPTDSISGEPVDTLPGDIHQPQVAAFAGDYPGE